MTKKNKATAEVKTTAGKQTPIDTGKIYPVAEAVDLVKKLSKTKFDASLEVHFRLGIDAKKGEQQIRLAVALPHGTGKTIKIAAFVTPEKENETKATGADYVGGVELINEIKKTEKTDFDIAIAQPAMMKSLNAIAKILGTRGLMPTPKNDTVTNDPVKTILELKKGKVSLKNDDTGNVHAIIGKVSFENKKLLENLNVLFEAIKKAKPASSKGIYLKNISLNSTMGPGIKISV